MSEHHQQPRIGQSDGLEETDPLPERHKLAQLTTKEGKPTKSHVRYGKPSLAGSPGLGWAALPESHATLEEELPARRQL